MHNQEKIAHAAGIELIITTAHIMIQKHACRALRNLAIIDDNH